MTIELSKVARMALDNREVKQKIADQCKVLEGSVYYWIRTNSKNLLRMDVLTIISQETGLPIENLIEYKDMQPAA